MPIRPEGIPSPKGCPWHGKGFSEGVLWAFGKASSQGVPWTFGIVHGQSPAMHGMGRSPSDLWGKNAFRTIIFSNAIALDLRNLASRLGHGNHLTLLSVSDVILFEFLFSSLYP